MELYVLIPENKRQVSKTKQDTMTDSEVEIKDDEGAVRKSTRKRFPTKQWAPSFERKGKKRYREDDDQEIMRAKKISRSEFQSNLSNTLSSTFQPVFAQNLEKTELSTEKEEKRSQSLRKILEKAVQIVQEGMVYAKAAGHFLVTSSDRRETYNVKVIPQATHLHHTCDCGYRYNQGDRTACKHIFAVVVYSMDSIVQLFFQGGDSNLNELEGLISKMQITSSSCRDSLSSTKIQEPTGVQENDYFSELCRKPTNSRSIDTTKSHY